jgi:hypothetical protein
MSEKVYPLFEFDQINVRGTLVIDKSKGLVERVFVESVNADGANEYMESIGANFNDYCSCCGSRWYRATKPVSTLDNIDVRYSKEPVAVHYIDGSFVIWEPKRYAKPEPASAEEALKQYDAAIESTVARHSKAEPITERELRLENERILEALVPIAPYARKAVTLEREYYQIEAERLAKRWNLPEPVAEPLVPGINMWLLAKSIKL